MAKVTYVTAVDRLREIAADISRGERLCEMDAFDLRSIAARLEALESRVARPDPPTPPEPHRSP